MGYYLFFKGLLNTLFTIPYLIVYAIATLVNYDFDPEKVSKLKTPILLIHGSNSNKQQWLLFKRYLESEETGHVFTVNLNERLLCNDKNITMDDYVKVVKEKIYDIKNLYYPEVKEVILIGNSMGGLVAGSFLTKCNSDEFISIPALISISTPWGGSYLADLFCSRTKFPDYLFLTSCNERDNLKKSIFEKCKGKGTALYSYGSQLDYHVPHESSVLCTDGSLTKIDDRNDHFSTMFDRDLAKFIRVNWILPHTKEIT
jgi:hypothetical protein